MRCAPSERVASVKGIIPDFDGSQMQTFNTIGQAYDALMKWIEANGYHIAGPSRELYVKFSRDDLAGNVTELQFPVEKA